MIDLIIEAEHCPAAGTLEHDLIRSLQATMRHFKVTDKEITLILVNDPTIRSLKLEHWGEDAVSDVLSFPNWEPSDSFMPPHLGDIFISLDTAQRQAQERGHCLTHEVVLLASHGLTHLMGYDHPHAEGLGYEEGATGAEWEVFHTTWQIAKNALTTTKS